MSRRRELSRGVSKATTINVVVPVVLGMGFIPGGSLVGRFNRGAPVAVLWLTFIADPAASL